MQTTQKSIKVLLADDHPVVRSGIRAELEGMPGVQIVGEAGDGREALGLIKIHAPDIVIMDISMQGMNGIEAAKRISKEHPGTKVVILSVHESEEYYWQALRAGASGYLLKKAATAELLGALQRVMEGEIYLSRLISDRLLKKLPLQQMAHRNNPLEELTERQREILQLIAEGQTTKAIALILNLSPKTVEYHRSKLMERLKIYDIPGLVRFALQKHIISEEG